MNSELRTKRTFWLKSALLAQTGMKAQPPPGFTLIELLVVITIIGILIGITIPSLVSFNRRQQIRSAVAEIKSSLRVVQSRALASQIEGTCPSAPALPNVKTVKRLRGWYGLFEKNSNNFTVAARCVSTWLTTDGTPLTWGDFGTRTVLLPKDVVIGGLSVDKLYVLFSPTTEPVTFYSSKENIDIPNNGGAIPAGQFSIPLINKAGEVAEVVITATGEIK